MRGCRLALGLAFVLFLALWMQESVAAAESDWKPDESGRCVREWNAAELIRGPTAITNGLLLPLRGLAGGTRGGALGVVLSPLAAVAGVLEGGSWILAGTVDLLTGGALAVTPDGLAQLRVTPLLLLPTDQRSYEEYRNHPGCSE